MVYVGHYLKHYSYVQSRQIIVHCTGFQDYESGVEKFEIGIGSSNESDDVFPMSGSYGTRSEFLKAEALLEGHVYYAIARVRTALSFLYYLVFQNESFLEIM